MEFSGSANQQLGALNDRFVRLNNHIRNLLTSFQINDNIRLKTGEVYLIVWGFLSCFKTSFGKITT